ncbi:hypothetical protein [Cupriavidus plantarum]
MNNPLALSVQDAQVVGGGILLCWAGAYVIRVIIAAISSADEESASS